MSIPSIDPCDWRGQPAWRLANRRIEVVVTAVGAKLACLRHVGDELNPLWQPGWPAAAEPDPAVHGDPHGEGRLLASAAGSFLCLDRFGPPRPGEQRPFHGEAAVATWTCIGRDGDAVALGADLPLARLSVRRSLRLVDESCLLATTALASDGCPHEVEWCEHATLGDPFLDGASIAAGIDRVDAEAPGVAPATIASVLAMPRAADPPRGDLWSGRVAEGWWRAERADLRRRLSVAWERDDFPWLVVWTEHRSRVAPPWRGGERARGLELSTKPFPTSHPHPEEVRFGRAASCRIPATSGGMTKRVTFTWTRLDP
jgi:hypothetical protein